MSTWIDVFAPATVANLGPGYDVLGLALEAPGDTVRARRIDKGVLLVKVDGEFDLPPAGESNTASVAARLVLERLGNPCGVELELHKGLPMGSGLGSSGASAAAAAMAVNLICGAPLSVEELVQPCALAEQAACGSAHADNVTPALLGGITLVRSVSDVSRVRTPLALFVAVVSPRMELSTREARGAIPKEVPVKETVHNSAHTASLVYALAVGDLELLGRSMNDQIAEPRRAPLIPGFARVKGAALAAGAIGSSIAGAGPSIFALCESRSSCEAVGEAMSAELTRLGQPHVTHISAVADQGARQAAR